MRPFPISAIIIAKNAERSIRKTLQSLTWCGEIIIVDDYSNDATIRIAKKFTRRIYQRHLNDDFADQRNFAMKKAIHNWVFFVDADEVIPSDLRKEICATIQTANPNVAVLAMRRADYFLGHLLAHGSIATNYFLRVLRKKAAWWEDPFLEQVRTSGEIVNLQHKMIHTRMETIEEYATKINFYSTIAANHMFSRGQRTSVTNVIWQPIHEFLYRFIVLQAFWDGAPSLIFWLLIAYMNQLEQLKLWYLQSGQHKQQS